MPAPLPVDDPKYPSVRPAGTKTIIWLRHWPLACALVFLLGGLRHHEQTYNLRGAKTFLSLLIPLATLALI